MTVPHAQLRRFVDLTLSKFNKDTQTLDAIQTFSKHLPSRRVEHNVYTLTVGKTLDARFERSGLTGKDALLWNAFLDALICRNKSIRDRCCSGVTYRAGRLVGKVSVDARQVAVRLSTKSHDPVSNLIQVAHILANSCHDSSKLANHFDFKLQSPVALMKGSLCLGYSGGIPTAASPLQESVVWQYSRNRNRALLVREFRLQRLLTLRLWPEALLQRLGYYLSRHFGVEGRIANVESDKPSVATLAAEDSCNSSYHALVRRGNGIRFILNHNPEDLGLRSKERVECLEQLRLRVEKQRSLSAVNDQVDSILTDIKLVPFALVDLNIGQSDVLRDRQHPIIRSIVDEHNLFISHSMSIGQQGYSFGDHHTVARNMNSTKAIP
ncbi:hypothetical protein HG531_006771 [Fusarium graminearum]|nr:hypothetical protein HG531_006771 [Fusarium graminearum]